MAKEIKKATNNTNSKNVKSKKINNEEKNFTKEKEIKGHQKKEIQKTKENVNINLEINKKDKNKKKIEKISNKTIDTLNKIEDNRKGIILFIIGFLIATLLFRCILWPDRISTLKDGTQPIATLDGNIITADDLYTNMKDIKKNDSFNVLLNDIDKKILLKKYPLTDEIEKEIQAIAKEQVVNSNGFKDEKDLIDNITLAYIRNKYFEDYVLNSITEKEINEYYKNEVFGDVDSKHILVSIKKDDETDGLTNEEAKKLAEEIIRKLNNGTSWDDVVKEYDQKITYEKLGYQPFNAQLEKAYLDECKNLKVNTYSKTPVLTSYGYHIIYKIAQKDKPQLKDIKDDIKEILAKDLKDKNANLYYESLIKMREDANLKFVDTTFADEYNEIVRKYK